ncbi:ATP-dependent 6-phosphofructokinase [Tautonia rosea]|uniref:ATP-dependent 6-phosphofructokinase n=1 Tax=Tautonia rosea TaxID=2728037 RepID=UPI00147271C4|nr:ATP-dependent 6-phosphofructokinase [Tautonia rosea]
MLTPSQEDLRIITLGPGRVRSPMASEANVKFVDDRTRVRFQQEIGPDIADLGDLGFEKAGPREHLFFDPSRVTAAIVTCGGLCPGLNNVIRSVTLELHFNYGVRRILGIREGYRGLNPEIASEPKVLTLEGLSEIQNLGGTVLGSSRGPQPAETMVDFLVDREIDMLFCVGGDGTMRGAHAVVEEVARRGLRKAVVGIPKTIDNDIQYVSSSFGYSTALQKAEEVIRGAHVEAKGTPNGIGLVKLMGRDAGFIAAGAALASTESNFVLIPEIPFPLEGSGGFLDAVEQRIRRRGHAVIVVAEGAGQHLFEGTELGRDASGNRKYVDIGTFLRDRITQHFAEVGLELNLKYFDPSYLIRSVPANSRDRILSDQFARAAGHAAMAGKTDVVIGFWGETMVHVPIRTVVSGKKRIDVRGDGWNSVLNATGQPRW